MSEARDSHFIVDNQRQVERLSKLGWSRRHLNCPMGR